MAEIQDLFEIIISRIYEADLRLKASKINLKVKSADTRGLHWEARKLSPTPHKLDPLAQCKAPRIVKAVWSFIGGIRFQEICLPRPQLALAIRLLDEQIPADRSGKELIEWTPDLLASFKTTQQILRNLLQVTIPRKGDTSV
jgi:hypothetical protein